MMGLNLFPDNIQVRIRNYSFSRKQRIVEYFI
jgi:hypothetical protein